MRLAGVCFHVGSAREVHLHAARATASTTGTAMATVCPLLWCPPEVLELLDGVTADRVDVAMIVAFVPAAHSIHALGRTARRQGVSHRSPAGICITPLAVTHKLNRAAVTPTQ